MSKKKRWIVGAAILGIVVAPFLVRSWRVYEAKLWCEQLAALIEKERKVDPAATASTMWYRMPWHPKLFWQAHSLGTDFGDDGEVIVSFDVGSRGYSYSKSSGWSSYRGAALIGATLD